MRSFRKSRFAIFVATRSRRISLAFKVVIPRPASGVPKRAPVFRLMDGRPEGSTFRLSLFVAQGALAAFASGPGAFCLCRYPTLVFQRWDAY